MPTSARPFCCAVFAAVRFYSPTAIKQFLSALKCVYMWLGNPFPHSFSDTARYLFWIFFSFFMFFSRFASFTRLHKKFINFLLLCFCFSVGFCFVSSLVARNKIAPFCLTFLCAYFAPHGQPGMPAHPLEIWQESRTKRLFITTLVRQVRRCSSGAEAQLYSIRDDAIDRSRSWRRELKTATVFWLQCKHAFI